jgi:hypothetical protein
VVLEMRDLGPGHERDGDLELGIALDVHASAFVRPDVQLAVKCSRRPFATSRRTVDGRGRRMFPFGSSDMKCPFSSRRWHAVAFRPERGPAGENSEKKNPSAAPQNVVFTRFIFR